MEENISIWDSKVYGVGVTDAYKSGPMFPLAVDGTWGRTVYIVCKVDYR